MEHSKRKPCIFTMYEETKSYKVGHHFFLSIGPYVARNTHFLEDCVLDLVLRRIKRRKCEVVNALRDVAMEVRDCYEGANIPLEGFEDNNEFVTTLVRDGCFVIELMHIMTTAAHPFRTMAARLSGTIYPINTNILRHMLLDLLMMRNQIPLNFLQHLYQQLGYGDPSFEDMVNRFLNGFFMKTFEVQSLAGACHLLDAARIKFLPKLMVQAAAGAGAGHGKPLTVHFSPLRFGEMGVQYSAVDLMDSRVTISPAAEGMVRWKQRLPLAGPLLELPSILINRDSNLIFRNMVAYEQRIMEDDDSRAQPVSSYLRLLSDLVLTAADARSLTSQGIINNQLGGLEDVVNFFKDLRLGDTYGVDMLSEIRKQINEHCQRKWISWWADLRRTYFMSPWAYCTFAAAIVLLVLTFLQVLYAALAYHLPTKN